MSAVAYLPPDPTTLAVIGAQVLARYARRGHVSQLALPLDTTPEPPPVAATPPTSAATTCWHCGAPATRITCGARVCRLARRRHVNAPSHARQNARRKAERQASPAPPRRRPVGESADVIEARYQRARAWRRYCEAMGLRPSGLEAWATTGRGDARILGGTE